MENQINVDDQNPQQIGQNLVSQPVQIPEKSKANYWMISALILAILFFGILGLYVFSLCQTNQLGLNITPTQPPLLNEFVCSQDSDCVIGIQTTSCCSCPEAINKELVGTKDWEQYEFGEDYSSRQSKSCGGTVACKPCELPVQPICSRNKCQFPSQTNIQPSTIQKQNSEVFIQLEKTIYQNNDRLFEPVKYSLVNNSPKKIYFLSGCAVVIPELYKIQDGQKTKLQKSAVVCETIPLVNQVSPGSKIELGWNQQNLGKFVEDGQYQLLVEYSFEKAGDYGIGSKLEAISDIFTIEQITWDINMQKQICELYGAGFHSNDLFYSKQDCLDRF